MVILKISHTKSYLLDRQIDAKVSQKGIDVRKRKVKYLVITATLVPEAEDVKNEQLEKEIREEVEKMTIPWVKEIMKVTISDPPPAELR